MIVAVLLRWEHGYQYQPDTGAAPPPFVEEVPTFNVRVKGGRVFVDQKPNPAGTRAEPATVAAAVPGCRRAAASSPADTAHNYAHADVCRRSL